MHEGLSWAAIAAVAIPLVMWMLTTSAALAVVCYQVRRLTVNHLPHVQEQLERLLQGKGPLCHQHEKQLTDHETRIREVED